MFFKHGLIFHPTAQSACKILQYFEGALKVLGWSGAEIQLKAPLPGLPFWKSTQRLCMVSVHSGPGWASVSPCNLLSSLCWSKNIRGWTCCVCFPLASALVLSRVLHIFWERWLGKILLFSPPLPCFYLVLVGHVFWGLTLSFLNLRVTGWWYRCHPSFWFVSISIWVNLIILLQEVDETACIRPWRFSGIDFSESSVPLRFVLYFVWLKTSWRQW